MSRDVRYFCDRCGKELLYFERQGVRLKARLMRRAVYLCRDCDKEYCRLYAQWFNRTGRFKP